MRFFLLRDIFKFSFVKGGSFAVCLAGIRLGGGDDDGLRHVIPCDVEARHLADVAQLEVVSFTA